MRRKEGRKKGEREGTKGVMRRKYGGKEEMGRCGEVRLEGGREEGRKKQDEAKYDHKEGNKCVRGER